MRASKWALRGLTRSAAVEPHLASAFVTGSEFVADGGRPLGPAFQPVGT